MGDKPDQWCYCSLQSSSLSWPQQKWALCDAEVPLISKHSHMTVSAEIWGISFWLRLEESFVEQCECWEPVLRGSSSSCGAGQGAGNTWAQRRPSWSTGRGQQQNRWEVNTFHAFHLLLWSVGAWLRAVEDTDQVGKVKLCVFCAGADVVVVFLGLCWHHYLVFPPRKEGELPESWASWPSCPQQGPSLGWFVRPWVQWGGSGRIVCYGNRRQEKPNPCGKWGDSRAGVQVLEVLPQHNFVPWP